MAAAWKGVEPSEGGLLKLIKDLGPDDEVAVSRAMARGWNVQRAELEGAGPQALAFLKRHEEVGSEVGGELSALRSLTGSRRGKPDHTGFALERSHTGQFFVPIREGNRYVAIASAKTRGEAPKVAERMAAFANKDGKHAWSFDADEVVEKGHDRRLWGQLSRDEPDLELYAQARESLTPRGALFNKAELAESVSSNLHADLKYMADLSSRYEFSDVMNKLSVDDPGANSQLMERLGDLNGRKGAFNRLQNEVVDRALGSVFGKDSASKMVRSMNEIMYHMNLGGIFNLAYPVSNLFTFVQTVMPEMAFIQYGAHGRLGRYYTNFMMGNELGKPRQILGTLDIMKLMGRSFSILANPERALGAGYDDYLKTLNALLADGTMEPRMLDEFVGPTAKIKVPWREAIGKPGNWWEGLKQASSHLPEASERLSRMHTITAAHEFGREAMGLRDDGLHRFVKEFTNRTMFGYNVADRPRAFLGPMGSAFGLFKNWQMHYLFNQLDYLGEGVAQNNWRPFLWSTTGAAVVGGIPAAGGLGFAADQMSHLLTDQSLMDLLVLGDWGSG